MIEEKKHENFRRIASRRTENVLIALRSLKMCSNKRNYKYTDSDVIKIFSTINNELRITKDSFKTKNLKKFKL